MATHQPDGAPLVLTMPDSVPAFFLRLADVPQLLPARSSREGVEKSRSLPPRSPAGLSGLRARRGRHGSGDSSTAAFGPALTVPTLAQWVKTT